MKFRKITAIALSLCIAAGIFSGCSGSGEKKKETGNTETVGKYVEENIELPIEQNETPLALLKNANGELEVYTCNDETEVYSKYTSTDGKSWTQKDASWLSQIYHGSVLSVAAGEDGNSYAVVGETVEAPEGEEGNEATESDGPIWNMKMHLLKQTGEGTAEEISIPELNEAVDEGNPDFYSFGIGLMVMKNGNIVLTGNDDVKVYDASDGTLLHTFPYSKTSTDALGTVAVNGEKLALTDKANTGFTIWNVEQEKEEASASYGSDVRSGKIVLEENNEIYFLNEEGIHHMNPNGTLVETLVEGNSMTMGLPSVYIEGFVKGEKDDFYALYTGNQTGIRHYYYDENAKTGSGKKLSIYSLEENDTVRQAVSIFQQKYPDVEITYKTGEADSSTTKADKIRVLNTELLNKSGADVLVLDDLPVDSFIEKGVLKDISDILNPLIEDGTLKKNLAECFQQTDGKIYSMPVKYGIPILLGKQEMVDSMESLDSLENWLDTHEGQKIISEASYEELTRVFVNMYYDELIDENGKLREDKLKQCISCVKKVGERYDAELENNYVSETGENMEDMDGFDISDWRAGNEIYVAEEEQVAVTELKSLTDMMAPFTIMRDKNLPLTLNKGVFVPHGVVGINSASENTDLAEEFVKILFSDEVQSVDLMDGFPMNQNVEELLKENGLDSPVGEDGPSVMIESLGGDEGEDEGYAYTFGYPLKTEVEALLKKAEELKKPAQADSVLQDMIWEEAKAYYEGSQELEQTVQGITAKVDTYRAE